VHESFLIGLASIIVLGIISQWIAWRLHLPAILLLLVSGIIAGPVTGILHPDELFGELLFPLISVSVAIILFEGGLSLRIDELKRVGKIVRNLTTIGILVTWALASAGAYYIVGIELGPSILLGAILVVSGPTVIIPLLRQVRPVGNIGAIVKWEGIVNDPIGAVLAVLVYEVIVATGVDERTTAIIFGVLKAGVLGTLVGVLGAIIIILLLRKFLVPDFLQNPVSLMVVVIAYAAANAIQSESGLVAVTVMGIVLTNQKFVPIGHITEFKENLRVLLISSVFIILAARLPLGEETYTRPETWIFIALLIILVRPIAVWASTIGSDLKLKEKAFIGWMAPRGIVAAAVISVFAIRLTEKGFNECACLVPLTFQVIIVSVAVYGLTAAPVARFLKVAQQDPQGVLIAGAHEWAREIARILKDQGFKVMLIDNNWFNVSSARKSGIDAHYGNILSENIHYDLPLDGIGRVLALTPNDEVNSLAAMHFIDVFGRSQIFQLPPTDSKKSEGRHKTSRELQGRLLFHNAATFEYLSNRFEKGAVVKRTEITDTFDFDKFESQYGRDVIPLFIITQRKKLRICTADMPPKPQHGEQIVAVVDEDPEKNNILENRNSG